VAQDTNEWLDLVPPPPDNSARLVANQDRDGDAAAGVRQQSRDFGVPATLIGAEPDPDFARRKALQDRVERLNKAQKLNGWLAAQDDNTFAMAQDDLQNLGDVETTFSDEAKRIADSFIKRPAANFVAGTNIAVQSAVRSVVDAAFSKVAGSGRSIENPISNMLDQMNANSSAFAEREGMAGGDYRGRVERDIAAGMVSLFQNAPPLVAAVLARNPSLALSGMSGIVYGQSYAEAVEAGLDPGSAFLYGAEQAGIEYWTEAGPLGTLFKGIKAGSPFLPMLMKVMAQEQLGEQVATHTQDAVSWLYLNPDKTLEEFLAERKDAAISTAISTAVATGLQTTGVHVLQKHLEKKQKDAVKGAEQGAKLLEKLLKSAEVSAVRNRDVSTFESFVETASKDSPLQNVYISAQALEQSGRAQKLSELSPTVAAQFQAALATGGDIQIPISELMGRGADIGPELLQDLRTDPNGLSVREAAEYEAVNGTGEEQINKILDDQAGDDQFKASRDRVIERVQAQLTGVGRQSAGVQKVQAQFLGAYMATQAANLGIMPEEFADRYMPSIVGVPGAGVEQDSLNFKSWFLDSKIRGDLATGIGSEPTRLYHGTYAKEDFTTFDPSKAPFGRDTMNAIGSWFTDVPENANIWAGAAQELVDRGVEPNEGSRVMPVYAAISNPMYLTATELRNKWNAAVAPGQEVGDREWKRGEPDKFRAWVYSKGYDGIVLDAQDADGKMMQPGHYVIALEPEQVKSAVGNNGEFSIYEADILKQSRESDIGHKRESSGRYVGAPDWVGSSPQKLAALRAKLRSLAAEGEAGRYWYENSSRAILQMVGGDVLEAERVVSLIAIYSPNATVPANTTMALTAYFQWKAGQPINAGFGEADKKAEDLLRNNNPWSGIKTNSFYQNLMVEIDPSKLDPGVATMDMWMAIAFDYGMKALDQGPKYKFSEREIGRLADELGWKAHQVQAAIWTAMKGRVDPIRGELKKRELKLGIGHMVDKTDPKTGKVKQVYQIKPDKRVEHFRLAHKMAMAYDLRKEDIDASKYDFSNAIEDRLVQLSWEATPGTGLSLPGIHAAPIEQKFEYLAAVREALTENGRDLIADLVDLPQGVTVEGFSAWEGDVGAGAQTFLPVPSEGAGKARSIKPAAAEVLDLYSAVRGLVTEQKAVVYHTPVWDDAAIRHNGVHVQTSRPFTEAEIRSLYAALSEKFGTQELAPAWRPDGVRILNFVEGLDNKTFQKGVEEVLGTLPDALTGTLKAFRSDGNYISNDWEASPNGEDYTSRIEARRPDILGRVADLRARVVSVNQTFERKYGWDKPGVLRQSRPDAASDRRDRGLAGIPRAGVAREGSVQARGVHYSRLRRETLESSKHGTGKPGAEARRLQGADPRLSHRIYFYVDTGGGVDREAGVGSEAHEVDLQNLYDGTVDPLNLWTGRDANAFEVAVLDNGFDGYVAPFGNQNAAVLLGERSIDMGQGPLEQAARGTFNPATRTIALLEAADLSTFFHEAGHYFLDIQTEIATQPNAPARVVQDLAKLTKWFGFKDIAEWDVARRELNLLVEGKPHDAALAGKARKAHEQLAESFEHYLRDGKAPNTELQPIFSTLRAWMKWIYKALSDIYSPESGQLNDEVREVFDRMLATDEQIALAKAGSPMNQLFNTKEEAEKFNVDWANYHQLAVDDTRAAQDELAARAIRDLQWLDNAKSRMLKELQAKARDARKIQRERAAKEVRERPVYRAQLFLKKGEKLDESGNLVKIEGIHKLSSEAVAEILATGDLGKVEVDSSPMRGLTVKDGLDPQLLAEVFGFANGSTLVQALATAAPINEEIEALTDRYMLEEHADLTDEEALNDAINRALHNKAHAKVVATELAALETALEGTTKTKKDKNGRQMAKRTLPAAAKKFAEALIARTPLKRINPKTFERSADRAAGEAAKGMKAGDIAATAEAKRNELVNNYAATAARDAVDEITAARKLFDRILKAKDDTLASHRDMDFVNAARAMLAPFNYSKRAQAAAQYMLLVKERSPSTWAMVEGPLADAQANAKDFADLTLDELRTLRDEVEGLWVMSKRSKQMEIDGKKVQRDAVVGELQAAMVDIGIPDEVPGQTSAVTDEQRKSMLFASMKAALRRVESWVENMDRGKRGAFRKYIFEPIKLAAERYRTDKLDKIRSFRQAFEAVAPTMKQGLIVAPELNYTFGAGSGGVALNEILHAMLHTGNESNARKLLLGRGWAVENELGEVDTSRWDAFMSRMHKDGIVTKEHWDFVQKVWGLLDSMKAGAQAAHRDAYGRYFSEVTANPVKTPFGTYAGGYVPASVDPADPRTDGELRSLIEQGREGMAYAFPATGKGFTKARVEYNRPLLLDLRSIAQHIDKVLKFTHLENPVRDVAKLLRDDRVKVPLNLIDSAAINHMLTPWLTRAAAQTLTTPTVGMRWADKFLNGLRIRTSMATMFANLVNGLQQFTGFSLSAIKVGPKHLLSGAAQFMRHPRLTAERVASLSPYMAHRMQNEVAALTDEIEKIMLDPSTYEKTAGWFKQHQFFLQSAIDNTMGPMIWVGAYEQALDEGIEPKLAARAADAVIRQTQGTTLPEDVSNIEVGSPGWRLMAQFAGYFNMQANLLGTEFAKAAREMGAPAKVGRGFYVYMMGFAMPAIVGALIAQAFRGGPDDEDDDGEYLDDWIMSCVVWGQIRNATAFVPVAGQLANNVMARFNKSPVDDKLSIGAAISQLESAGSVPYDLYKVAIGEIKARKTVRDVATLVTLLTGLPAAAVARPAGYVAGVAAGEIEPTSATDAARGLITGQVSPESRAQ
jgi:hypothetical protein